MIDLEDLQQNVDKASKASEIVMGFKLDYTPSSLKKLDKAIDRVCPFGERRYEHSLSKLYGTYIGMVIIKRIDGSTWGDFPDGSHPNDLSVIVPAFAGGSITLCPIMQMEKFINEDRTATCYNYYATAKDISTGRMFTQQPTDHNSHKHISRLHKWS